MNNKAVSLLKMLALAIGLIAVCAMLSDRLKPSHVVNENGAVTQYDFAMGTSVAVSIYDGNADARKISDSVISAIKELDSDMISWRASDSELSQLNQNYSASVPYEISDELADVISQSLDICKDSEGALDITIRPLADAWNIEASDSDSFEIPAENKIREALEYVGYERLTLSTPESGNGHSLIVDRENMIIDLGALGKGYALNYAEHILDENKAYGALVSVGGSVMIYGSKPDKSDWRVGIRNPKGSSDDMLGYLSFPAGTTVCISTSGDYEKYFMVDGRRYHHILDRSTGYPAESGISGVTVVCENGLVSDALSTACFVLGYERSLPLLEKYNAEALFIDSNNEVTVTDGLVDIFSTQ